MSEVNKAIKEVVDKVNQENNKQAVLDFLNERIKHWQNYQRKYHHKQRGFQMATEMINEYKQQKQKLIK